MCYMECIYIYIYRCICLFVNVYLGLVYVLLRFLGNI